MKYRIVSYWPNPNKNPKIVGPKPHAERNKFDLVGLYWTSQKSAEKALEQFRSANAGRFEIWEMPI